MIYRSHFGQLGDLVSQLLTMRDPENKTVEILSDLASFNNVTSDQFHIERYGCASHARRYFAKNPMEDEDWGEVFLNQFGEIYCHEEMLDAEGRRDENVSSVRKKCSKKVWDQMHKDAKEVANLFSRSTELGGAVRYLIDNFEELTAYLDNPRIMQTNDLSERLLRPEKQIQSASLFRNSIDGRCALDITRSVLQTSIAANAATGDYLNYVLKTPPELIEKNPESYTPLEFLRRQ